MPHFRIEGLPVGLDCLGWPLEFFEAGAPFVDVDEEYDFLELWEDWCETTLFRCRDALTFDLDSDHFQQNRGIGSPSNITINIRHTVRMEGDIYRINKTTAILKYSVVS